MLEVLRDQSQRGPIEPIKHEDTIVRKAYNETTYEDGKEITVRKYKEVNVTKKVNETAKMVKQTTAQDKLKELEELLTKEVNKK